MLSFIITIHAVHWLFLYLLGGGGDSWLPLSVSTAYVSPGRISVPTSPGMFRQDFDNDGESGAGSVLLHLLQVQYIAPPP